MFILCKVKVDFLCLFLPSSVKSWVRKDSGLSKLSKLYVANVNRSDSGLYTCSLGRYGNATVFVSVLNGNLLFIHFNQIRTRSVKTALHVISNA